MPNLRGKTWTTTTPANVGDAQYWEDHLISDAVAAKAASSVQSVNNTAPDEQGNVDIVTLPDGGTAGQVLTKQSSVDGDADWEDPASSGHTIVDEDDTDMPYRTNLQFLNAEVTDDSVNDATVVDCKGSKGDPGDAATITVGTVTTLPAGSSATIVNSGTTSAAVFDFGIPKGKDGTGAVDSVNGQTGIVTLGVGDLDDVSISSLASQQTIVYDGTEWGNEALADVALSGSYNDLSDQPTIPTVEQTYSATSGNAQSGTAVAEVVEQIYADNGVLGAKNLLPNNAKTQTINGVTFTVNDDGSVTANGTATADATFVIFEGTTPPFNGFVLNGCPSSGGLSKYFIGYNQKSSPFITFGLDIGNGTIISIPSGHENDNYNIYIRIRNGITIENVTFYPMIRRASDPDDTYVPYAMTNRELTDKTNALPREVFVTTDTRTTTTNDANTLPCGFIRMSNANSNLPTDGTDGTVWYDILTVRQSNDSSQGNWGYGFQLAVQTTSNTNMGDTYVRAVNGGATPTWSAWKKLN